MKEILDQLAQIQLRLTADLQDPLRPLIDQTNFAGSRGVLLLGPRGVGKTTLLLKQAASQIGVLYLSADHPLVGEINLWSLAESAFAAGWSGLAIDEVHYAKDWSKNLKAVYDSYPKQSIWASDSSSIVLRGGNADLSRRFVTHHLPYLSFGEYITLKHGITLAGFDPFKESALTFGSALQAAPIMRLFAGYREEGFRPIFREGNYTSRVLSILNKTVHSDIPYFVPRIQDSHLRLMRAIIAHLAGAVVPTINIDAMCSEWSVGKEKLYELLAVLEHVGLLTIVRYPKDRGQMSKGAKIFFSDPTIYHALGGNLGTTREALAVAMFKTANYNVHAAKIEEDADFIVDGIPIEIGGKSKKRKKAKWVIRDDLDLPRGSALPLWAIGMRGMK